MNENSLSTFDKFMEDENQRELFALEYNDFLISEFLLEAMEENSISVRKLSEKSGVSTSIIQKLKTEKGANVTLKTMFALASSLGYRINFEKMSSASK